MRAVRDEPTKAELQEIEAEWPVIEAELAVVDAEIVMVRAESGLCQLDLRRLRRAEARVTRRMQEFCALHAGSLDGAA